MGYEIVLQLVGAITIAIIVWRLSLSFHRRFIRKPKDPKQYGKWAIITGKCTIFVSYKCDEYIGSTSGIGKEYADYLAKKGMSVMIISRSEDRLKEQAEELRKAYKAEIKYIAHDFTNVGAPKEDFYRKLEAECVVMDKNGGIGLLINNVGIANQYPQLEREITEKEALDMINCNIDSTVFMTKAILKFMEARNSGGIVNVSSQSVRRTFVCIFV